MIHTTHQLDITGDTCPMTFVKAKLRLETLNPGEILEVRLKGEEPLKNVPRSAEENGYRVLSTTENPDGTYILMIQR